MRNVEIICNILHEGKRILAIDGRCTSGKTTLAEQIEKSLPCNIVHIDDFYLPFSKRTKGGSFFSILSLMDHHKIPFLPSRPFDVAREESTTKKLKNKARNQAESIVRKLIEPVAGDKRELIVKWIVRKKAVVNGGFA